MNVIARKSNVMMAGLILFLGLTARAQRSEPKAAPLREEPLLAEEAAAVAELPLGLTIRNNERAAELAMTRLRKGDHVIVGPDQAAITAKLPKDLIKVLFLPSKDLALLKTEMWQEAIKAADMFSLDDTRDVEAAQFLRKTADQYGKKVLLAPTGEVADKVGRQMAPYGDAFLLQAQRWLQEDTSRDLKPFCEKVHQLAGQVRQGNPKAVIWVQVGRRLERGGGTAGLFIHAYARLKATHPEDLQMMHPFIAGGPDPKPGHGIAALEQFLDALRPRAVKQAPS